MKNAISASLFRATLLLLLCLLPATVCIGQENNDTLRQNAPSGQAAYQAQAGQEQKAEALRNVARKEYDVCLEHCADDTLCMARCGKVYGRRLQSMQKDMAE